MEAGRVMDPTRERVSAYEKALGCERLGHVTYETCLVHGVAVAASLSDPRSVADALSDGVGLWTDAGCPVAVAAARVDMPAIAERDALRAVVEQVRALAEKWDTYGEGSPAAKAFGPQRIGVEFAAKEIRALLPEPVE